MLFSLNEKFRNKIRIFEMIISFFLIIYFKMYICKYFYSFFIFIFLIFCMKLNNINVIIKKKI